MRGVGSLPDLLERRLLRKGLRALDAVRERCGDCGRTPLVGERVHVFADGRRACDLCLGAHRGEPERSESVLPDPAAHHVRIRVRPAA